MSAYSDSLHRVYLAYSSGLIRQIDLASTNFAESPFASLPQSPRGLATADSYVFAMDPSGAWSTHYTFDSAGTMVDSRDWNYYSTEFIWSKVNQKMYFFRDDTSPNDLLWEEINANGIAYTNKPGGIGRYMDSPLHDSSGFVHPIRVAPDGSIVVLGSGVIHDAITLARLSLSLGNAINDAAWVDTDLKTVRTINDVSQYQAWTKPNFGLGTVRQFPGTAHRLFALQPDRLLGISMLGGRPSFYVLDAQFNVIAPPVLQPPTALSAGVLSATQINLTWQDTSGEESYIIERKTGDDGAWTFLSTASTSATEAADGTVLKGNNYYYHVLASNGSITSAPSAVVTVRLDAPETPTNLVGSALSSSAILLSWANVQGEASYIVERQEAGGSWIGVATVQADTTTWTDSNLSPNTQYTYRLHAVNGIGTSPASAAINVLTDPVPPTAPWFGGANASGPYSISLSWYGSYYQDNFVLERRSGTNDSWHFLAMTGRDITYYEDVGLKPSTYYEYRVYATNAAGASPYAYSPGVNTPQVPPPPAPGYLMALPVSASQVRITWADVSEENGYRIQRSSETTNWVEVAAVPAGTTIFTDTNLLAGVSYSYRVSAYNDYGTSGYSAIATVIPVTVLTLLNDDFDPEPDPAVWASISGAVATNGGAGFQGSHALWFHAGGARAATTVPIKISQGGLLSFQFRAGNEAVDGGTFWNNSEPGEGVLLEYSVDGVQWSLLSSLDTTYPSFSNWTPFSVPVPAAAWGPHTQFRWRQVSNSGPSLDCWALEHLRLEGWYPPLSAPAALVAAWETPASIGLQWIDVDGADSYSLERQQESGPWLTIAAVAAPASAFTDTNVATNSTYSYRLKAINAGGQSPYSQVAICAPWTPKQAWIYSNYGSADTLSSDEFLNPGPDGIAPLLRYAFNLSAHEPSHVLQPGRSTGGTPAIWLDPIRHRLQAEFVRRKAATNPAIQYQVQFTSSASDWSSPGVELTATQIDATWERVRCEDNTTTEQVTARFCRVGIRSD